MDLKWFILPYIRLLCFLLTISRSFEKSEEFHLAPQRTVREPLFSSLNLSCDRNIGACDLTYIST